MVAVLVAAAEREATILESLAQAREAQKLEKERRLIEQAQQEKEEFDRILRVQREAVRWRARPRSLPCAWFLRSVSLPAPRLPRSAQCQAFGRQLPALTAAATVARSIADGCKQAATAVAMAVVMVVVMVVAMLMEPPPHEGRQGPQSTHSLA